MYKVLKKFYDPLRNRFVLVNEVIEIPEQHLKGYIPYVQAIEKPKTKKGGGVSVR